MENNEMHVEFVANRNKTKTQLVQFNNAKICFRNFKGEKNDFNAEGARNFSIVIPDEDIKEALANDVNEFDVGWKVKIRPGREPGDPAFMHLPVKIKYTSKSAPKVYLRSGNHTVELTEETVGMLDDIAIDHVDVDIRPYDDQGKFGPFRAAYLQSIWVVQDLSRDRFASRMQEDE